MHHIHSLLSIGNIEEEIRILDLRFKIGNWEKGMNVVNTGVTLLCVRHRGDNLYSTTRTIQVAVGFNLRTTAAKAINSMITVNSGISTSYWEQTFKTNLLHVKNVVVHIYFERHAFNCQSCSCIFYMIHDHCCEILPFSTRKARNMLIPSVRPSVWNQNLINFFLGGPRTKNYVRPHVLYPVFRLSVCLSVCPKPKFDQLFCLPLKFLFHGWDVVLGFWPSLYMVGVTSSIKLPCPLPPRLTTKWLSDPIVEVLRFHRNGILRPISIR